jgi:polyhydroxyalkanoate synthesis regulator phasin
MADTSLPDLARRALSLGLGVATLTREKAEEIVKEMIDKGEVKKTEAKAFLATARTRGKEIREELQGLVEKSVDRGLSALRVTVKTDVQKLEKRVATLEARLKRLEGKPARKTASTGKKAKKKATGGR